ncbi:MAG TPA: hypothetical protein VHF51_18715, partial [Solirubrobacteraceae bacterium]|nr:hypothetical protein [Solirubrobacteraceae bacterium]
MPRSRLAAAALACAALAGCGGGDEGPAPPVTPPDSSWTPGQGGLTLSRAYLAVATPADARGEQRLARYLRTIELIDARRKAQREKERQEALRRYRLERARALARYRAALAKARRERERQQRLLARQRAEARRRLRELLEKLHVPKGHECEIPEVQRQFDCVSGRQPLPDGKKLPRIPLGRGERVPRDAGVPRDASVPLSATAAAASRRTARG